MATCGHINGVSERLDSVTEPALKYYNKINQFHQDTCICYCPFS